MSETAARPRVRRGLWIAGLVLAVLALGGVAHFVVSGAMAGFPITMISQGRSWFFIGGYLVVGYVGLLLLGLARPRAKREKAGPVEPVDSTRAVSENVDEVPPKPLAEADGTTANSDDVVDDEV